MLLETHLPVLDLISQDWSQSSLRMLENNLKINSDEESGQVPQTFVPRTNSASNPMQQTQGTALGHYNDEPNSSSESESSSGSDSEVGICSSDTNSGKPSLVAMPELGQTANSKWQLDKWLNKVNTEKNDTTTVNKNGNYGLSNYQLHCRQQNENQERAKNPLLSQTDFKDQENQTLDGKNQRSRPALKTKCCKQMLLADNESAAERKLLCKEQSRKTVKMSIEDDLSLLSSENQSMICNEGGSQDLSTSDQDKIKPPVNKIEFKREQETGTLCEKIKYREIGKNVPKSGEFVGAECLLSSILSGSRLDSDNEQYLQIKYPLTSVSPKNHKVNDYSSGVSRVRSCSAVNSVSGTINESNKDSEEQLFALVPFGRNELLSPLKGSGENEELKSLWVKIDLTLLSRIPGQLSKQSLIQKNVAEGIWNISVNKGCSSSREKLPTRSKRKRKCENSNADKKSKRNHLDNKHLIVGLPSTDNCSASSQKATSINELSKQTNGTEKIIHPFLSPLPGISNQKHPNEINTTAGGGNDTVLPSNSSLSLPSLSWKSESKPQRCSKDSNKGLHINSNSNQLCNSQSFQTPQENSWLATSKLQNDSCRPRLVFDDNTQHNADYYMQEAKRKKHKADAMVEKFGKAVNYIDAALSFIECGNEMEHGPLEAKSPYMMYSETVELIRYAMRLKIHSDVTATQADKQLAALCYRCLALLYWRMFRLKRDSAVKYSKALIDYFKCNRKEVLTSGIAHTNMHQKELNTHQYCSCPLKLKYTRHCCNFRKKQDSGETAKSSNLWGTSETYIRTSTPKLSTLSPVTSAGLLESRSSNSGSSPSSTINIPQRIHQLAANHVNITNSILYSYDYWEMADKLTKENKEFFHDLDTQMGPITLQSSMKQLVRYTQQGLHWIRISSHML
ncbi:AF4/FMR2 family member 3 [Rhincodon typus]|uniref:AF4/FMR2 family member 3 n=1 Tax=Rhincodon typus TaxID=259920 RepID=UPI00202E6FF1|nr:AF4/FMR2 family member 3 [Rhincodon typus]